MKLLITGATGFIGSCLSKQLLAKNHSLCLVVRKTSSKQSLDPRAKVFVFDGNLDKLIAFMGKEKFDGVIHLASLYLPSHETKDVAGLINSNLLFSTQMLEAAAKSHTPWFINTGSFAQHFRSKKYSPVNLYAATKQAFEDIAQYYLQTSEINFVTIKLFDTFGPNDTRPKIFAYWSKIAQSGEALAMSPGAQIIDVSYVDDVAQGFIQMAKLLLSKNAKKYRGQSFTLSSGNRMSLKKLAQVFEQASGEKLNIKWGQRPYKKREVMVPFQGRNVPGWKPKTPLKQAIKLTLKRGV